MEFRRTKNVDTRVVFPIQKTDGTFITGATGLDSEYALLGAHGGAAPTWTDCTHEATEIGTTGMYYLDVSAAELNDDYAAIQIKSTSTGAITQVLLFNLTNQPSDVINWKGSAAAALTGDPYAEAAAVHAHVNTIDGHITADYGSTEKTCIDLLDDANGLVNIHDTVDTVAGYIDTEVGAIKTQTDKLAFTVANQVDANVLDWKGGTAPAMTGDAYARLGAPAGASVSADVAAVKGDTAAVKTKTDNLPASPAAVGSAMTLAAGAITAAVVATDAIDDDAIATGAIASTAFAAGAITAAAIADNAIDFATFAADCKTGAGLKANVESVTAAAITAAAIAADAIGASELAADAVAEIADQVWDEAIAGHAGAGSTGLALAGASAPTANAVADQVWDEVLAGHAGVGSTGEALASAGAAGDPWNTLLPGAYGAGKAGKIVGDNINAPLATIDTVVDAIKAKTDTIGAGTVTVTSPVASDGVTVTTYRGDDYKQHEGREIRWLIATPDLSTAVTTLHVGSLDIVCTLVDGGLATQSIYAELTAVQTATLLEARGLYSVTAAMADADVRTLVVGEWKSEIRVA